MFCGEKNLPFSAVGSMAPLTGSKALSSGLLQSDFDWIDHIGTTGASVILGTSVGGDPDHDALRRSRFGRRSGLRHSSGFGCGSRFRHSSGFGCGSRFRYSSGFRRSGRLKHRGRGGSYYWRRGGLCRLRLRRNRCHRGHGKLLIGVRQDAAAHQEQQHNGNIFQAAGKTRYFLPQLPDGLQRHKQDAGSAYQQAAQVRTFHTGTQ